MLRGRSLALAILFAEGGPQAATGSTCAEAATINEAFAPKRDGADARFAGFLHELCEQAASAEPVTATLQRLDARHAAPTAHHLRIAHAINASWSRTDAGRR